MRTIAAFGLVFFLAGCDPQSGTDINPSSVKSRDEAMASAKRSSGPSADVCAIAYDSDGDGVNDSTLFALGEDDDGDGLAVIPIDPTDIFANGQYGCSDVVLNGFVVVTDATVGLDCDDADATVGAAGIATYLDVDGDGYGDKSDTATMVCTLSGEITDNTDCDDSAASVNPGATEVCDAADVDEDCDGAADDSDSSVTGQTTSYLDGDSDGYGDAAISNVSCDLPLGYVANSTDCDDSTSATNPAATETCNGVDDDCASGIDNGLTFAQVYPDLDADGFGDEDSAGTSVCDGAGLLESTDNTDCDDTNSGINTSAVDIADDGIDQDCDGSDTVTVTTTYAAVCATGAQVTDFCVMYLSDMTVYPYTPDDTGWWTHIYASGVGEVCTTEFPVVSGNTLKIGLQCDNDSVVYWGWMVDGVHATTFTVGGTDLLSSVVNTPYDDDGDGIDDGADGVVLLP